MPGGAEELSHLERAAWCRPTSAVWQGCPDSTPGKLEHADLKGRPEEPKVLPKDEDSEPAVRMADYVFFATVRGRVIHA